MLVKGVYDYNSGDVLLPDFDRDGQWEFYKDARGVLHYFYIDPTLRDSISAIPTKTV